MALYRLILLGLFLTACAGKQAQAPKLAQSESIYRSPMASVQLFQETKKFLQWSKGYNISYTDPQRGLLVTDWMNEDSFRRHRLSLRVNHDISGSILTAHASLQEFRAGRWIEIQVGHRRDDGFIDDLARHLKEKSQISSK